MSKTLIVAALKRLPLSPKWGGKYTRYACMAV
jgi:hypothetical protein